MLKSVVCRREVSCFAHLRQISVKLLVNLLKGSQNTYMQETFANLVEINLI